MRSLAEWQTLRGDGHQRIFVTRSNRAAYARQSVLADLVAVGDVMLDLEIERLVPGQRVHAPIRMRPGGSATNAALWARSQGASAAVVGRIGNDPQGSLIQGALAEGGVIARLAVDPEAPTGTVTIVDLGRSPTVVADRRANANFAAADVPALRWGAPSSCRVMRFSAETPRTRHGPL
jgi:sugar/nucleoside kinase (ribokinase family)